MQKIKIKHTLTAAFTAVTLCLTGCGTPGKGTIPPAGDMTMAQIYYQKTGLSIDDGTNANPNSSTDAPDGLAVARNTAPLPDISSNYTGDASDDLNQLNAQFKTLSNPQILVYVMPHLVTTASNTQAPVPGYVSSFFLYPQNEFAMPYEHY